MDDGLLAVIELGRHIHELATNMIEEPKSATAPSISLTLAAEIVAAYVANNVVATKGLPDLIRSVHAAISGLGSTATPETTAALQPAVPIRKSVFPDYIVCLEDGRKLKLLKRHLRTAYDMTPEQYRAKWKLASDYPMVAPAYAAQRVAFAKSIGLGRRAPEPPPPPEAPKPARRRKAAAPTQTPA